MEEGAFIILKDDATNELSLSKISFLQDNLDKALATVFIVSDHSCKHFIKIPEDIEISLLNIFFIPKNDITYLKSVDEYRLKYALREYWNQKEKSESSRESIQSSSSKSSHAISEFLNHSTVKSRKNIGNYDQTIKRDKTSTTTNSSSSSIICHQPNGATLKKSDNLSSTPYNNHNDDSVICEDDKDDENYEDNEDDDYHSHNIKSSSSNTKKRKANTSIASKTKIYKDVRSSLPVDDSRNNSDKKDSISSSSDRANINRIRRDHNSTSSSSSSSRSTIASSSNSVNSNNTDTNNNHNVSDEFKDYKEGRFIIFRQFNRHNTNESDACGNGLTHYLQLGRIGFTEEVSSSAFVKIYEKSADPATPDTMICTDEDNMVIVDFQDNDAVLLGTQEIFYDRYFRGYRLFKKIKDIWQSRNRQQSQQRHNQSSSIRDVSIVNNTSTNTRKRYHSSIIDNANNKNITSTIKTKPTLVYTTLEEDILNDKNFLFTNRRGNIQHDDGDNCQSNTSSSSSVIKTENLADRKGGNHSHDDDNQSFPNNIKSSKIKYEHILTRCGSVINHTIKNFNGKHSSHAIKHSTSLSTNDGECNVDSNKSFFKKEEDEDDMQMTLANPAVFTNNGDSIINHQNNRNNDKNSELQSLKHTQHESSSSTSSSISEVLVLSLPCCSSSDISPYDVKDVYLLSPTHKQQQNQKHQFNHQPSTSSSPSHSSSPSPSWAQSPCNQSIHSSYGDDDDDSNQYCSRIMNKVRDSTIQESEHNNLICGNANDTIDIEGVGICVTTINENSSNAVDTQVNEVFTTSTDIINIGNHFMTDYNIDDNSSDDIYIAVSGEAGRFGCSNDIFTLKNNSNPQMMSMAVSTSTHNSLNNYSSILFDFNSHSPVTTTSASTNTTIASNMDNKIMDINRDHQQIQHHQHYDSDIESEDGIDDDDHDNDDNSRFLLTRHKSSVSNSYAFNNNNNNNNSLVSAIKTNTNAAITTTTTTAAITATAVNRNRRDYAAVEIPYIGVKLLKLGSRHRYCAFLTNKRSGGGSKEVKVGGLYDSSVEAALAYDAAVVKFYGEYAVTNFQNHRGVNERASTAATTELRTRTTAVDDNEGTLSTLDQSAVVSIISSASDCTILTDNPTELCVKSSLTSSSPSVTASSPSFDIKQNDTADEDCCIQDLINTMINAIEYISSNVSTHDYLRTFSEKYVSIPLKNISNRNVDDSNNNSNKDNCVHNLSKQQQSVISIQPHTTVTAHGEWWFESFLKSS